MDKFRIILFEKAFSEKETRLLIVIKKRLKMQLLGLKWAKNMHNMGCYVQ